ncbi:MAG: hypothetical protein SCK57_01125 [Bacillota bacterium]|nr:hypothetical protein [Bacillota bacterium]MDW7676245.1 hypothetical protein [Bacillota bacterium]
MPGKPTDSENHQLFRLNHSVYIYLPLEIWNQMKMFEGEKQIRVHLEGAGEFILQQMPGL